jgi:hypothetical protein
MKFKTLSIHTGHRPADHQGAVMTPIADSGRRRKGFRGEREKRSGVKTNGIPG